MVKASYVPQRTCIACGCSQAKKALVRLVRVGPEQVEVSLDGRTEGRGAYVCPLLSCWQEAFKKGRLERALRVNLSASTRKQLQKQGSALLGQAFREGEVRG